jgi:putative ABC transport system ATP-binding protein
VSESAADPAPVLRARGLSKWYDADGERIHALREVDLDLYAGEVVVLLGPSGSGKTTLLNLLGGLDVPSAGTLHHGGLALHQADDATLTAFRRAHVGFVFQFYNLIPNLTALENIEVVTALSSQAMPPIEALALVGLAERGHAFPAELSGGQQQRVAIARAIARRPSILLCDEPTGALDSTTGQRVLNALLEANRTLGTLTIIITHNAALAELGDRALHLRDGRVVAEHAHGRRLRPEQVQW